MFGPHGRHVVGRTVTPIHGSLHRSVQRKNELILHLVLRHIDLDDERRRIEIRLLVDQQRVSTTTPELMSSIFACRSSIVSLAFAEKVSVS